MEELFRFVAMRPANPATAPQPNLQAQAALVRELAAAGQERPSVARSWLQENYLPRVQELHYTADAAKLAQSAAAEQGAEHPQPLSALVQAAFGTDAAALAQDNAFGQEHVLTDSAATASSFSGPTGGIDPVALHEASTGFALVLRAAAGEDGLAVRLTLPTELAWRQVAPGFGGNGVVRPDGAAADQSAQQAEMLRLRVEQLGEALRLASAPAAATEAQLTPARGDLAAGAAGAARTVQTKGSVSTPVGVDLAARVSPLLSLAGVASVLPSRDLADFSRTSLVQTLSAARVQALRDLNALNLSKSAEVTLINGVALPPDAALLNIPFPLPLPPFPIPLASGDALKPVGVGDLMLVREQIVGYEAGEIAHIENILRTEKLDRKTRRLESTTTTVDVSVETDKEEERDSQSTDRYDLKRETSNTVKNDTQLKGELSVDAKYGPMVEVKADVSASTQTQTEASVKTSTEFSKEVVSRSVSKVATKVRQEQITKTVQEYEEWYEHGFDNSAAGASNIAGVYQWIDKVSQAQIFNYGKRLLFDCVIPEPARFYIWAQSNATNASVGAVDPGAFTLKPSDVNEGNYQDLASQYGAADVTAPPDEWVTSSKAYDQVSDADPHAITKSDLIPVPDGYVARWFNYQYAYTYHEDPHMAFDLIIGESGNADGMTGSVPVAVHTYQVFAYTVNVTVTCQRADSALANWREKTFGSIYTGWLKLKQDYDQAVAAANAQASASVQGRNPATNAAFVLGELRKGCIEELTLQQFDSFGAIVPGPGGVPQLNLSAAHDQGKYIAFFEEAFEWEHIAYYFFPYYWGTKANWKQTALFDDTDPDFGSFLRAGAARVVFPVRPGFEKAIVYFLSTGQIWDGGDPPDISSSEYVPIVEELEESLQHPGDEVAVGDPWLVRTPTTLVKLRADDTLPKWSKQPDGTWAPAN